MQRGEVVEETLIILMKHRSGPLHFHQDSGDPPQGPEGAMELGSGGLMRLRLFLAFLLRSAFVAFCNRQGAPSSHALGLIRAGSIGVVALKLGSCCD